MLRECCLIPDHSVSEPTLSYYRHHSVDDLKVILAYRVIAAFQHKITHRVLFCPDQPCDTD